MSTPDDHWIEMCQVWGCEGVAQVLVDVPLARLTDDGVEDLPAEPIAMCRLHAQREREAQ